MGRYNTLLGNCHLKSDLRKNCSAIYAGVDMGKVHGPSSEFLPGDKLVGTVVGLRGCVPPGALHGGQLRRVVRLALVQARWAAVAAVPVMVQVGVES